MLNSNIGALKARIRTGLARVTTAAANLADLASIASPFGHVCSVGRHVYDSKKHTQNTHRRFYSFLEAVGTSESKRREPLISSNACGATRQQCIGPRSDDSEDIP